MAPKALSFRVEEFLHFATCPTQSNKQKKLLKKEARDLAKNKIFRKELQFGQYSDGLTFLETSIVYDHQFLFDILLGTVGLDTMIDVDKQITALHYAARIGRPMMVEGLITKYHCDVEAVDICNSRPLHYAIREGNAATVLKLIDCGASVTPTNFFGTPLHAAAYAGIVEGVKSMCDKNNNVVNVVINGFNSPLVTATFVLSADCIEYLAQVSTDPNLKPLLYKAVCASKSELDCIRAINILLPCGQDANHVDEVLLEELPVITAAKLGWRNAVQVLLGRTEAIDAVDWTVDGVIAYVNTNEFKDMDENRKEARVRRLRALLIKRLQKRNFLSADLVCRSLRIDMDDTAWGSLNDLCQFHIRAAESGNYVECNSLSMLNAGGQLRNSGHLEDSLLAAKAVLALEPDNGVAQFFFKQVTDRIANANIASSSGTCDP